MAATVETLAVEREKHRYYLRNYTQGSNLHLSFDRSLCHKNRPRTYSRGSHIANYSSSDRFRRHDYLLCHIYHLLRSESKEVLREKGVV